MPTESTCLLQLVECVVSEQQQRYVLHTKALQAHMFSLATTFFYRCILLCFSLSEFAQVEELNAIFASVPPHARLQRATLYSL